MRHQRERLTYGELDERSNGLARGFQNLGVQKGDRVAVSLGNNIEFAVVGRTPSVERAVTDAK